MFSWDTSSIIVYRGRRTEVLDQKLTSRDHRFMVSYQSFPILERLSGDGIEEADPIIVPYLGLPCNNLFGILNCSIAGDLGSRGHRPEGFFWI